MVRKVLPVVLALAAAAGAEDLAARWDKPRRESFEMKGALPAEIADEIRKRYGIPFAFDAPGAERTDFVAERVTFHEALDRFAAPRGLLLVGWLGAIPADRARFVLFPERPLALVRPARPLPPVPVVYAGPSRIAVQNVSVHAATRWMPDEDDELESRGIEGWLARAQADAAERSRLRIGFKWNVEPGFEGVTLVDWKVTRAEDDRGQAFAVTIGPDGPLEADNCFDLDFGPVARAATAIARLEGTVRFALPEGVGQVEFLATEGKTTKALGDARIEIRDIDTNRHTIWLAVEGAPCAALMPKGGDLELRAAPGANAPSRTILVTAYGADGGEIPAGVAHRFGGSWDVGRTSYRLELDAEPARLVLRAVTKHVIREMPYVFTNIPLPE